MKINIEKAKIINRPSKTVKSPYMADVKINNTVELVHSPSLGLCGIIIEDVNVLVSKCENNCRKSKYTIELVETINAKKKKVLIGANSLYANKLFKNFFIKFDEFKNYSLEKQEVTVLDSRLDFLLVNKKEKCYVEVKNVPLVSYDKESKITSAIFPDGYKNSKKQCISDRAFKHVENLMELKKQGYRVCLIFIIQRDDVDNFKPNYIRDKIYAEKLKEAYDKGVEIYAYKFKWQIKNSVATCKFMEKINVYFDW